MDQKQNEEVFAMLECGDIALSQRIDYAIAMFGMTRRGKTTLGHYLSGEALKGFKDGTVFYKATSTNSKYKNAKIGNTPNSETQIPNYFYPMLSRNQKITLIDCPGFQDSKGCHKIITNGYFNYRVFSKVKNMKFILVIKKEDLQNDAASFHKTLISFFDNFKNIEGYLDDILNATCFVINRTSNNQDNIDKLKKLKEFRPASLTTKNYNIIVKFIDNMISKGKVYGFQQAKQNLLASAERNPLKDILEKTKNYDWSRELAKGDDQSVDMSCINFSIMKEIDRNRTQEQFWKQYLSLMDFFTAKIKGILTEGFSNIFEQIIQDSFSLNQQECNFMDRMKQFSDKWGKFIPQFETQRKNLKLSIFNNVRDREGRSEIGSNLSSSPNANSQSTSLYWIKKVKVVDKIFDSFFQFSDGMLKRNYEEINDMSIRIIDLIRTLNIIARNRDQKQVIIPNYGYILFRLFQEAKILFLLFYGGEKSESNIMVDQTNFFDFSYPLKEAISGIFSKQIIDLKKPFALQYEIKNNLQPKDYSQILDFYKSITAKRQELKEDQLRILRAKQTELLLQSSAYYLNRDGAAKDQKMVISDLNNARKNLQRQIQLSPEDTQGTKTKTKYLIQLVKNMGDFLFKQTQYKNAIKCFKSINFVPKVLEVYQKQVDITKEAKQRRLLLIQMGQYAYKIGRQQLGLQKLQQAYCLSTQINQFNELAHMIFQAGTQKIQETAKEYLKNMMQDKIYQPLSAEDCKSIEQYCEGILNSIIAGLGLFSPQKGK